MRIRVFIALLAVVLSASASGAEERLPDMSVAELEELLAAKGTVKATFITVPEGSQLKEYDIKLRGIVALPNVRIVVFTSRDFVVGGMSGSPVRVKALDGSWKLLGAVAYRMTDFAVGDQWGGISPIQYMRGEAGDAKLGRPSGAAVSTFTYEGKTFTPIAMEPAVRSAVQADTSPGVWPLAPGYPISVDILDWVDDRGVLTTISATGTITDIATDGTLYAFGHPFLGARKARYNFRTCRIIDTVYALDGSFKLAGERSDVLGTIEYDGAYGIYGKIGRDDARRVTEFDAVFSRRGRQTDVFHVRMATTPLTSLIMGVAFNLIGDAAKVPFPREASTVAFSSHLEISGHESVDFSQVFVSTQTQFGPNIIHESSYENAYEAFMNGIYIPLTTSRRGFQVSGIRVRFDFNEGLAPSMKVASVKFPTKVRYGEDPVLELLLVSEDNTMTLSKRTVVRLDWDRIERPVYTADTKDTDKLDEKIVYGMFALFTANYFTEFLSDNEKETETPLYFLDSRDYLSGFRQRLTRTNRMLYARVAVRKKSGLDDVLVPASGPDVVAELDQAGWTAGYGLVERRVTVQKDAMVRFWAELPPVPVGSMMESTRKVMPFEVVN